MLTTDEIEQGLMAVVNNIELHARAGWFGADLNTGRMLLEELAQLVLDFMDPDKRDNAWGALESIIESSREETALTI